MATPLEDGGCSLRAPEVSEVVLADNIKTFPKPLAPYVAHVCDLGNGFQSVTLPLGQGTEYSVRL